MSGGHWFSWAKAVAVELAQEHSEQIHDPLGFWGARVCRWAREIGAVPRHLSPALALSFQQSEQPRLMPDLPRHIACFWLFLPKGTLFSEEGPEILCVLVAEVRAMAAWLLETIELAGGGPCGAGSESLKRPHSPHRCGRMSAATAIG